MSSGLVVVRFAVCVVLTVETGSMLVVSSVRVSRDLTQMPGQALDAA